MRQVSVAQLADDRFVSLPAYEGLVLPDRLRRLARASGFVANVVQIAPDTQTAMALVSVEVGCHLTFASGARNATDPRIVFGPLAEAAAPDLDVDSAPHGGVTTGYRRFTRYCTACSPSMTTLMGRHVRGSKHEHLVATVTSRS